MIEELERVQPRKSHLSHTGTQQVHLRIVTNAHQSANLLTRNKEPSPVQGESCQLLVEETTVTNRSQEVAIKNDCREN
eukprot:2832257-Amphidinium_carterae.1